MQAMQIHPRVLSWSESRIAVFLSLRPFQTQMLLRRGG